MKNIASSIKIIEAVKNHPKLFINSIPIEEQDSLKEWSAVADECKLTRSQAQDQWNLLLLQYVEYLRSNEDFSLAKHMDFLQPHFFTVIDNENIDEDELLNALESNGMDEININKVENKLEEPSPALHENIKIERSIKSIVTEEPPSSNTTTLQQLPQIPLTRAAAINANNNHSLGNLSSLELIFLGYAKQLQNMPLPLQLKTKRKISDLMDEAELEMMS